MSFRRSPFARCLAAATAVLVLAGAPTSALAAERQNPWTTWADDLDDRWSQDEVGYKVEVPFLVLISIAPMIAITPIWLGQLAYDAAKAAGDEDEDEGDDESDDEDDDS